MNDLGSDGPPQWFQEMVMPDENQILDTKIVQLDRARSAKGYKFQTVAEMSAAPTAKDWLIKGIFARAESSAWVAPPKAMKSALLAEAAICVAAGLDWHGYRNKGAYGVVYFALERADLVRRRILAHVTRLGIPYPPIAIVSELVDPRNAKRIVETINEAGAAMGIPIGLCIFDTFAKLIAAAGLNENDAAAQGIVFASLQRVKNQTGVHPAIIGHTGKEVTRGMRGSNASLGDVDVMVEISGEDVRTATVTRANDAPEGPLFSFKSEVHEFGTDEDGDPITVNIVSGETVSETAVKRSGEPKLNLTKNQRIFYRLLFDAKAAGLKLADWNSQGREAGLAKASLTDARYALLDKGLVRNSGDIWKVNHD